MSTIDPAASAAALKLIREAWFMEKLREEPNHAETDAEAVSRAERNEGLKTEYDRQTYAIICGSRGLPAAPMTAEGVWRAKEVQHVGM